MLVKLPVFAGETRLGTVLGPGPLLPTLVAILALSDLPLITTNRHRDANSAYVPGCMRPATDGLPDSKTIFFRKTSKK
jgi:hypothetical protein